MLKRLLPFALTLLIGLLLGNLASLWPRFDLPDGVKWRGSSESHQVWQRPDESYELLGDKTWVVIHSLPTPTYTGTEKYGYHIVRVRVLLDASGSVTMAKVLSDVPESLAKDAERAALEIEFTPASKNGQLVSVYAVVQYVFAERGFRESAYPIDESITVSEAGEDWHVSYE